MNQITDWGEVFTASFAEIWFNFVQAVPEIIVAIIVVVVGILIAKAVGKAVARVAKKLYVDRAVEATGFKTFLDRIGFKMQISEALGLLITWFLYVVILVATADILGLNQISEFLGEVVLYIPNVIIAVVILLVGIIISNFVRTLVKETAGAAAIASADVLAKVAQWAILIFTVMAALIQLKVATELLQILFTGLVAMVALAGGIAFGIGGKDKAKEILDKLMK